MAFCQRVPFSAFPFSNKPSSLKHTGIFVAVVRATTGDEDEELWCSDGARFLDLVCFVFEVRFCFCLRCGQATVRVLLAS